MTETALRAVMAEPGNGRATWAMASLFEHLMEADVTGGTLGVALVTQPPGIATPLHRHTREAEAFFLVEGRMSYQAGEDLFELHDGCFIVPPPRPSSCVPDPGRRAGTPPGAHHARGAPRAVRRGGAARAGAPAARAGRAVARGRDPQLGEVAPRYGLEVVGPPIPA